MSLESCPKNQITHKKDCADLSNSSLQLGFEDIGNAVILWEELYEFENPKEEFGFPKTIWDRD